MNNIKENIKKLRKTKGLTQEQLAQQLYVTRQLISKWEQGKSLPDIENLKKLASIFEVPLSDLLDDESVATITIKEAIKNKKRFKYLWLTIAFSLTAIVVAFSFMFSDQIMSQIDRFYVEDYFYVTSFDPVNRQYTFTNDEHTIDQHDVRSLGTIYDNKGEKITFSDIKLNDNIKVLYSKNKRIIHSIQVIDSEVETNLYGVFVAEKTMNFDNIQSVISNWSISYVYNDATSSTATPIPKKTLISHDYYSETIYDIEVIINPLRVTQGMRIGLLTDQGITYMDDVDLMMQKTYTYKGEYELMGSLVHEPRSQHVTYNIHIIFEYSFSEITIYEYDKEHIFIKETTINHMDDLGSFQPHEDTLYGIFKIVTEYPYGNMMTTTEEYLIGDTVDITISDDYGFTWISPYKFQ